MGICNNWKGNYCFGMPYDAVSAEIRDCCIREVK